jgi:Bifunctional DNA primase/polymerase, N-terminal
VTLNDTVGSSIPATDPQGDGPSTPVTRSDPLDIALAHAARGHEVFPFRIRLVKGKYTKTPLVKWTQVATTDEAQIRLWAAKWPRAKFGWRLPVGTLVADVDDQEAFNATEAILAPTAGQTTPSGGYHRLYSGLDARQTVKVIDGLDTRVGGKGWVGLYSVDSFSGEVAEAPAWLLDIGGDSLADRSASEDVVTTRHGITRLMGGWRRMGMGEKGILAELRDRFESGLIASSDSARPWVDADFIVLASEAAKWAPAEELPPVLEVRVGARITEPIWTPLSAVEELDAKPLLLGRLDPDEHTVTFGTGGTGKGVLGAWWGAQLSHERDVLILDYERHTRYEWKPRVRRFGGDQDRVHIFQPDRPIWAEVKDIVASLDQFTNPYLIVDSVGYAVGDLEVEKSSTATKYTKAIQGIGLPTLSLAHTTKADADPRYPFGSVYWHNGARVTMSLVGQDEEPRVLTQKKTNQRALFKPVDFDWTWAAEGEEFPVTLKETPHSSKVLDRALAVFGPDDWKTPTQIHKAVVADGGESVTLRTIERLLGGPKSAFQHRAPGQHRPLNPVKVMSVKRVEK